MVNIWYTHLGINNTLLILKNCQLKIYLTRNALSLLPGEVSWRGYGKSVSAKFYPHYLVSFICRSFQTQPWAAWQRRTGAAVVGAVTRHTSWSNGWRQLGCKACKAWGESWCHQQYNRWLVSLAVVVCTGDDPGTVSVWQIAIPWGKIVVQYPSRTNTLKRNLNA